MSETNKATDTQMEATISFRCQCGRKLKAPIRASGKKSRCPACKSMITIPEDSSSGNNVSTNSDAGNYNNELPSLLERLRSTSEAELSDTVRRCLELANESIVPALANRFCFAKSANEVRTILEILSESLDDDSPIIRLRAVETLGRIAVHQENAGIELAASGYSPATIELLNALSDSSQSVQKAATIALQRVDWKPAYEPYETLWRMANANLEVKVDLRQADAWKPILALLSDEAHHVRGGAVKALERIRCKWAVRPLVHMLRDPEVWVREDAAKALGRLGDPRAIKPLIKYFLQSAQSVLQSNGRIGATLSESLVGSIGTALEQIESILTRVPNQIATSDLQALAHLKGVSKTITTPGEEFNYALDMYEDQSRFRDKEEKRTFSTSSVNKLATEELVRRGES